MLANLAMKAMGIGNYGVGYGAIGVGFGVKKTGWGIKKVSELIESGGEAIEAFGHGRVAMAKLCFKVSDGTATDSELKAFGLSDEEIAECRAAEEAEKKAKDTHGLDTDGDVKVAPVKPTPVKKEAPKAKPTNEVDGEKAKVETPTKKGEIEELTPAQAAEMLC